MSKKSSDSVSLNDLQEKVARFRDERNWKQHHNPKNLVISILVEVAELAEHFQWESFGKALGHRKDPAKKAKMADIRGIDSPAAIIDKLRHNREKFPRDKVNDLGFIRRQREKYRRLRK